MTVPPILDVNICFPVQFTDSGGRKLATLESLSDIFYEPDRYSCHVHLDQGFFYTIFMATVPSNDSSFKIDALELWLFEGDISRSGGDVAAAVAAAVAMVLLITLKLGSLCEFLCLIYK